MTQDIGVETVAPRHLAAVHVDVPSGGLATAWKPALDKVWAFLAAHPGLRGDGHNVFLYQPASGPSVRVDFGVEVLRQFSGNGEVACVTTLDGPAVATTHVGPYQLLGRTHDSVRTWAAEQGHRLTGQFWEIYADPVADPARLETRVFWRVEG